MSLHVLARPRVHALRHGWVREMRSLDRRLRRRIDAFAFAFAQPAPDLFLLRAGEEARTLADQLARIDRHPARTIREGFGLGPGGLYGETREQALAWAAANEPGSLEAIALLADDPREFARQYAELVEAYWRAAFAEEWQRVEPLLHDSVAEDRRLIASSGVWPFLARLPGQVADRAGGGRAAVLLRRRVRARAASGTPGSFSARARSSGRTRPPTRIRGGRAGSRTRPCARSGSPCPIAHRPGWSTRCGRSGTRLVCGC